MICYNFINFLHIIDLSLLNFIDYCEVIQESYQLVNNKFQINLNSKTKKLLIALILSNINDNIQYGKTNVIVNTCRPMNNWRKEQRNNAIRCFKYVIKDQSVTIDKIKLNQFLENIFEKLPKYDIKKLNLEPQCKDLININNLEIGGKVKFIQFEDVDIIDGFYILQKMFSQMGCLTFDSTTYNLIDDGNCVYNHSLSNIPDDIKENIRLQFLEKGLL